MENATEQQMLSVSGLISLVLTNNLEKYLIIRWRKEMNAEEIEMDKAQKRNGSEPLKPMTITKPDKLFNVFLFTIFISPVFLTSYFLFVR